MSSFYAGLLSISFRGLSPEEILNAASGLPLSGIEWGGDVHVPHGDLKTAERVGRQTREAGIQAFSYGSYYRFHDAFPGHSNRGPELASVLDTAEALGAAAIRVWVGDQDYENVSSDYIQRVVDRAVDIGNEAMGRGLRIDFEYHSKTLNNAARRTNDLLDRIDHENVRTLWQPAVPLDFPQRLEELQAVLPRLSNLHAFHWGPGGFGDRRAFRDGMDHWRAYLRTSLDRDHPRWVSLEYVRNDDLEALKEDSHALADLIAEMSTV